MIDTLDHSGHPTTDDVWSVNWNGLSLRTIRLLGQQQADLRIGATETSPRLSRRKIMFRILEKLQRQGEGRKGICTHLEWPKKKKREEKKKPHTNRRTFARPSLVRDLCWGGAETDFTVCFFGSSASSGPLRNPASTKHKGLG